MACSMHLGGDVDGLETDSETQEWFDELSHNSCHRKLASRICRRIVLDTVGRDLSTFLWCKVLLSCVADAVEGAQQAYTAGILHRDISVGNIMIVDDKKEWRGVLIDWDISVRWRKPEGEVHTGRPGTWTFRSVKNQKLHSVVHTLWDDMESAFWVLIYQALRYLNHSHGPEELFDLLQQLFDAKITHFNGSVTGGYRKRALLSSYTLGRSDKELPRFGVNGLNKALEQLGVIVDLPYGKTAPTELDQKRIPDLLRQAAMTMAPLFITPTGLVSPTNDSKPPADPQEWQRVKVEEVENDLDPMPWCSDPYASDKARMRETQINRARRLRHFDGYSISKRSYTSDSEDEEKGLLLKKRRKGPI